MVETCPICHKQMLSHDLAQVNQCMKILSENHVAKLSLILGKSKPS